MTFGSVTPSERTDRLIVAVRDLASARRMGDIVEIVRHAARELVNADGATFVLRDDDRCYYVDEDAIAPLWRGQRFPLEACVSGWTMLNRKAVAIPDIYLDERIPHDAYRPTFVHSLVMTPVRAADPVAAIGTYWADNHVASKGELDVLQALADSTAVAIESVRVLTELEDRVRQRTAALAAANRDLRAFAHLAAHDLRNPLMTASIAVELALKYDRDTLSPSARDALESAMNANQQMDRLIGAILEYSTVSQGEVHGSRVDINAVVARVLGGLQALVDDRHAEVRVETLPEVFGSETLVERVLQNLIANAVDYGDPAHPAVAVTGSIAEDGSVSVAVADNGAGVPARERADIFEMFTRGSTGRHREGFGIGLAFVARAMEKHGGTVRVGDSVTGGAVFEVTFPPA